MAHQDMTFANWDGCSTVMGEFTNIRFSCLCNYVTELFTFYIDWAVELYDNGAIKRISEVIETGYLIFGSRGH